MRSNRPQICRYVDYTHVSGFAIRVEPGGRSELRSFWVVFLTYRRTRVPDLVQSPYEAGTLVTMYANGIPFASVL